MSFPMNKAMRYSVLPNGTSAGLGIEPGTSGMEVCGLTLATRPPQPLKLPFIIDLTH